MRILLLAIVCTYINVQAAEEQTQTQEVNQGTNIYDLQIQSSDTHKDAGTSMRPYWESQQDQTIRQYIYEEVK